MDNVLVLTVSQLNTYSKSIIEADKNLTNVYVVGEISNFVDHYRSGHLYMSIKDSNASIKAVMFSSSASKLKFKPENGMSVIIRGRVSIYERDGSYQLYIDDMQPDGIGSLAIAFEHFLEIVHQFQ
jgi:exodeoxyribonuclease VII large subunit